MNLNDTLNKHDAMLEIAMLRNPEIALREKMKWKPSCEFERRFFTPLFGCEKPSAAAFSSQPVARGVIEIIAKKSPMTKLELETIQGLQNQLADLRSQKLQVSVNAVVAKVKQQVRDSATSAESGKPFLEARSKQSLHDDFAIARNGVRQAQARRYIELAATLTPILERWQGVARKMALELDDSERKSAMQMGMDFRPSGLLLELVRSGAGLLTRPAREYVPGQPCELRFWLQGIEL